VTNVGHGNTPSSTLQRSNSRSSSTAVVRPPERAGRRHLAERIADVTPGDLQEEFLL